MPKGKPKLTIMTPYYSFADSLMCGSDEGVGLSNFDSHLLRNYLRTKVMLVAYVKV